MGLFSKGEKSSDKYQAADNSDECNHPNQGAYIRTKEDGTPQMVAECGAWGKPGCGKEWTA